MEEKQESDNIETIIKIKVSYIINTIYNFLNKIKIMEQ